MKRIAWVAHTSRVLATVSSPSRTFFLRPKLWEKFVAVEHRDQHTRRVRYPELLA